jgi:fatty acid desaturase
MLTKLSLITAIYDAKRLLVVMLDSVLTPILITILFPIRAYDSVMVVLCWSLYQPRRIEYTHWILTIIILVYAVMVLMYAIGATLLSIQYSMIDGVSTFILRQSLVATTIICYLNPNDNYVLPVRSRAERTERRKGVNRLTDVINQGCPPVSVVLEQL